MAFYGLLCLSLLPSHVLAQFLVQKQAGNGKRGQSHTFQNTARASTTSQADYSADTASASVTSLVQLCPDSPYKASNSVATSFTSGKAPPIGPFRLAQCGTQAVAAYPPLDIGSDTEATTVGDTSDSESEVNGAAEHFTCPNYEARTWNMGKTLTKRLLLFQMFLSPRALFPPRLFLMLLIPRASFKLKVLANERHNCHRYT